jgi:hypothetical protein
MGPNPELSLARMLLSPQFNLSNKSFWPQILIETLFTLDILSSFLVKIELQLTISSLTNSNPN